ncbi:MAG: alpha/beta hydrolase family protein [Acidimicrobiia bacterium]
MTNLLDTAAGLALKMRGRSAAIFPRGWGDEANLELFDHLPHQDDVAAAEIVWDAKTEHRGFRARKGLFTSPIASRLPGKAGVVPVELIEPGTGSDRAVVLMPAWNDEGFERRRKIALPLLQRGVASVMFEIPLYGSRRDGVEGDVAIGSVSDFALMGSGALVEAHALLNALERQYGSLGVGGFSMGGNLAALVSAGRRRALATGLMAASHSPGPVYLDGVLSGAIDFPGLGPGSDTELRRLLGSVTVTSEPPRPHHRAAVLVAARGDGFVPGEAVTTLAEHWPGSELRWLPGGHGGLWWRHRDALVSAIADSFDRVVSGDR